MEIGIGEAIRIVALGLLRRLPSSVIRRFFGPEKVGSNVHVDLTSTRRLDFRFGTDIPEISVALRVTNLNPFPIRLSRIDLDLWIGQPIVKDRHVFPDLTVAAYSVDPPVMWDSGVLSGRAPLLVEFQLDELKVDCLRRQLEGALLVNNLSLRFDVQGEALGRGFVKRNQRIEVSRDELPPLQLRLAEFSDLATVQPGSVARSLGSSSS